LYGRGRRIRTLNKGFGDPHRAENTPVYFFAYVKIRLRRGGNKVLYRNKERKCFELACNDNCNNYLLIDSYNATIQELKTQIRDLKEALESRRLYEKELMDEIERAHKAYQDLYLKTLKYRAAVEAMNETIKGL